MPGMSFPRPFREKRFSKTSGKLVLIGPVILLCAWYFVSLCDIVPSILLPPPASVLSQMVADLIAPGIWRDALITLTRSFGGYVLGVAIGIPLGVLSGLFPAFYKSFEFPIDFGRSLPVLTLFPLFMVFFGIGNFSRIATAAYPTILIVLINTYYGVRDIPRTRLMVARTKNASFGQTLRWVVLPSAMPQIIVSLRVSLSWAYLIVIVTEMYAGSDNGLGCRVMNAYTSFELAELYATILITGTLGYILNRGLVCMEERFVHWAGK
jgi:NitT/TauT family transport system permease protein